MLKKKFLPVVLLSVCTLTAGIALSGCGPSAPPETMKYTVTFNTNGGSTIAPVEVDKNKRVIKPADPTRGTDEFIGWYTDNETFQNAWNFDLNIVTKDTTLYANWLSVYNHPSEVGIDTSSPFSNKLIWKQNNVATDTTTFTVTVDEIEKQGTWEYDAQTKTVIYTFTDAVSGGAQDVKISTTRTDTEDTIQDTNATVKFKGAGTEANPYRIYADTTADLLAITNGSFDSEDKFFKLEEDIIFQSNIDEKNNAIFKGTFDGNDKRILFSGTTNGGIFYEIANGANFKNTKFEGTVSTTKSFFAPVATHNKGTVEGIYTLMQIVSEVGTIGTAFSGNTADLATFVGGASGVVGVNHESGVIKNSTMKSDSSSNTLKVANGGGGMASVNYGLITGCDMQACIGGYNAKEVGKSNIKYSFLGGIAGYNYGTIEYCEIAGTGKILAQRYQDNSTASNIAIGGIAGVNGASGVIQNCSNEALRVHGDHYVGGIAGINFGSILASQNKSYVFAPALNTSAQDYESTMKGNDYIGGIAGYNKANATISECSNNYGYIDDDTSKNYLVFGDQYIGNIAGWNDGDIEYSMGYAKIGARSDFGGIASSNGTTGTVKNSAVSCTVDRGDLGSLADADAVAAINFWVISTSAENSAYNSTGTTRGVIPGDGTTYVNCVKDFKNGSEISLLDTLNKGTELAPKWMYISADTGSGNPAIQPVANAVATLTTVTGDAANLKATTYGLSKFGGSSIDVEPNGNAPEGYTFAGWALTPNGEILTEGTLGHSLVLTWTLTAGQNITVYAVYTANPVE